MHTLSLSMIVKNEEKHLARVLENAHLFADEIVIVDTGSTDNTKRVARQFTKKIYDFPWIEDFAAARNFGIDKCTKDFIMWLDADDIISYEDCLNIKNLMNSQIDWDICFFPYICSHDVFGNPSVVISRERIFRNLLGIYFQYPVHEVLNLTNSRLTQTLQNIKIVHAPKEEVGYSTRNLQILEKAIKEEKYIHNSRMWWNLAREYVWTGQLERSLSAYEKTLEMLRGTSGDLGNNQVSNIYLEYGRQLFIGGKKQEALKHFETAFSIFPLWREPLFEAAVCYYNLGDYKKALDFLLKIKDIPAPENVENLNIYDGCFYYDWLSLAHAANDDFNNALIAVDKALSFASDDNRLLENKKYWLTFKNTPKTVRIIKK